MSSTRAMTVAPKAASRSVIGRVDPRRIAPDRASARSLPSCVGRPAATSRKYPTEEGSRQRKTGDRHAGRTSNEQAMRRRSTPDRARLARPAAERHIERQPRPARLPELERTRSAFHVKRRTRRPQQKRAPIRHATAVPTAASTPRRTERQRVSRETSAYPRGRMYETRQSAAPTEAKGGVRSGPDCLGVGTGLPAHPRWSAQIRADRSEAPIT